MLWLVRTCTKAGGPEIIGPFESERAAATEAKETAEHSGEAYLCKVIDVAVYKARREVNVTQYDTGITSRA